MSYSQKFRANVDGHGFLMQEYIRDYTALQEGPLWPLLRMPQKGYY